MAQGWWAAQLTPLLARAPDRVLTLIAPAARHVLLRDSALSALTPGPAAAPGSLTPGAVAASGAMTLRGRLDASLIRPAVVSSRCAG